MTSSVNRSRLSSPANLKIMEETIRSRTQQVLDDLPVGEQFDWVDRVSIELTTQMLATLFDFPFEDRRKLTRWSDVATGDEESGVVESEEARQAEYECLEYFTRLWHEREEKGERNDLVSMLANGEATKNMSAQEYLGNLILLIVGGNDTTRNSRRAAFGLLIKIPANMPSCASRRHPEHGFRNYSLANAACAYASHR